MNPNQKREELLNKSKATMKSDYSYQTENNARYQQLVFGKAFEQGQLIKKELESAIEKFQNVSSSSMYKIQKRNN
jgi:hypothetical protein